MLHAAVALGGVIITCDGAAMCSGRLASWEGQTERGSLTGGLRWKYLAIRGAEYGGSSVRVSPITSGNCDLRFDVCCARCSVHRGVAQRRRVRLGGRSAMR